MRLRSLKLLKVWLVLNMLSLAILAPVFAQNVPRITKEELRGMLGDSNVVVLDVRESQNWQDSEIKIKGAIRGHPDKFSSWAHEYPKSKTLVLY
jgi:hypothetical protein